MRVAVRTGPSISAGAADSRFLSSARILTDGISGMFSDPATSGAHGLNERIPVRSLYERGESCTAPSSCGRMRSDLELG